MEDEIFKNIFSKDVLTIPKRWEGDFKEIFINDLNAYIESLVEFAVEDEILENLRIIIRKLDISLEEYFKGNIAKSYQCFSSIMDDFYNTEINSGFEKFLKNYSNDNNNQDNEYGVDLYRIRPMNDNRDYGREAIFHVPFNLRQSVQTCRYSIPGFPCLYLSTTLKLCQLETKSKKFVASRFKFNRSNLDRRIYVIDLAIKPEDLFSERQFNKHKEMFSYKSLRSTRKSYLYWYPLILGSSYIRRDKKDYFASEYIIPQFFMHWLHSRDNTETSSVGVRYFSCASIRASKFGYNYAFITSGENISNEVCYCNKLNSVFKWTKPKYMMEFESIESLQDTLKNDSNIQNLNDETFT